MFQKIYLSRMLGVCPGDGERVLFFYTEHDHCDCVLEGCAQSLDVLYQPTAHISLLLNCVCLG
jgi:hypothetical protein